MATLESVAGVRVEFTVVEVSADKPFIVRVGWRIFVNDVLAKHGETSLDARDTLSLHADLLESMGLEAREDAAGPAVVWNSKSLH